MAYANSVPRSPNDKFGEAPSVLDFGATGDGTTDDTVAIQKGIDSVNALGGGQLLIPRGRYSITAQLILKAGVTLVGEGTASILSRDADLGFGDAVVSITGSNTGLANLAIDGTTTSVSFLKYSDFSFDPLHDLLIFNTSIWIRPGVSNICIKEISVYHTGGYAILIDSDTADVRNVLIANSVFEQNRPHIFQTEDTLSKFGAWTGGIFYRGDCRNSQGKPFAVIGLIVRGCSFRRCTGNEVWGHSWGFDVHHQAIVVADNVMDNIGRDGILFGNVEGGSAYGNKIRVGLLTSSDIDTPVVITGGDGSVCIDTSGYCARVDYSGNNLYAAWGECIDLDGFRDGAVTGNMLQGAQLVGINTGDTQANGGAQRIVIAGNAIQGCAYASIRLNNCVDCTAAGNIIVQPATAGESPIQLNALSSDGCRNNLITGNRIDFTKDDWCVKETAFGAGTFTGSENQIRGNQITGANRGEFARETTGSGATTAYILSTSDPTATTPSETLLERLGFDTGAALRIAARINGTRTEIAQLQDANRNLLVGIDAGKGIVATGNRSTLVWGNDSDAMATSKVYSDGFVSMVGKGATAPGWGTTYSDAEADLIDTDDVGLIRYNAVTKMFEQSVALNTGSRVWEPLNGASGLLGTAHQIVITGTSPAVFSLADDGVRIEAATGIAEAVLRLRGELAQTVPLQEWRANDETVLSAMDAFGTLFCPAAAYRTDNWAPGSANYEGRFAAREIRFRQNVSLEDVTSGRIDYRLTEAGFLTIAGAGTGSRSIKLRDLVVITGAAAQAGLDVLAGYVQSNEGFATNTGATNAIQAPVGGVTARFLIATRSFSVTADSAANAGLSTSGNGRIYFDSTTNKFRISENGGAYTDLVGSTGNLGGSLTAGRVPYATGVSTLADTANFQWSNAAQKLLITGTGAGNPAITVTAGYVEADGGFLTSSATTNAIQAPVGGVTARYIIATRSFSMTADSLGNAGLSTSGNGRIYFDSTSNKFRVSESGGAYVDLLSGITGSLTSTRIPFASGASTLTDDANLTWDNISKILNIGTGYVNSASGFLTLSTAGNAVQAPLGGVTAKLLIATVSASWTGTDATTAGLSTGGNARVFFESSSGKLRVSENGGAYRDLVGAVLGTFTAGRVPYATGVSTLADTNNFRWDDAAKKLIVVGDSSGPAVEVTAGYIDADGGFVTNNSLTNSIQAPVGGVTARFLVATRSASWTADSAANAGLSTFGNGRIYFDSGTNKFRVSESGGAYVDLIGGAGITGSLTTNRIPVASGATMLTDYGNLSWDPGVGRIVLFANLSTFPAISITQGYVDSAGGFNTGATNYNCIQGAGGIRTGPGGTSDVGKIYVNFAPGFNNDVGSFGRAIPGVNGVHIQNQGQSFYIADTYDSAPSQPAMVGRRARGSIGSPSQVIDADNLFVMGGRGWQAFASDFPAALNCAITFQAAGLFTSSSTPTRMIFATTDDNQTSRADRMRIQKNGIIEIPGLALNAALQVGAGYISSSEGFYSPGNADATVNVVSGGVSANKLIVTQALYPSTRGTGVAPNNPGAGFGGIGHRSGSTYWYWNGASWGFVDFAAAGGGGVSSLNSLTGALNILGTANQVTVSPSGTTITLSLPQAIHTNADVTFSSLLAVRSFNPAINAPFGSIQSKGYLSTGLSAFNAIQSIDGGIAASTTWGFSLIDGSFNRYAAIDFSGSGARFIGAGGVNCGSTGAVAASGFNPNVSGLQFTGYSSDGIFGNGNTITLLKSGGGTVTLRFTRGALTFYSDP